MKHPIKKTATTILLTAATLTAQAASTEISWWHAMSGELGVTVNTISQRFNQSQSQCHLNTIYKGTYEEIVTAGIAAFRAKKQPNLVQVFEAGSATYINTKGVIYPVEKLFNDNKIAFDKQDYIAGVRNFYADKNGNMVGMPFNSSTVILYYNKAALAKAGVTPPKTWEEFEQIAPKLKDAGYIALSQSHTPWIFTENFFSRHNLPFADAHNGYDGAASKVNVTDPNHVMHFSKAKEWKDKGWFGFYGANWGDNLKPFEEGKVAMWLGSSGSFSGVKQQADFEFGTAFLPYWDKITHGKSYNTFIGGAALFAFAGKNQAENQCSAQFLKFMSQPEIQVLWHEETGYVPITKAAYQTAKKQGYYQKEPAAETGILQLSEQNGEWTRGYRLGYYTQIRDVMYREYDRIFAGEISAQKAMQNIDKEAKKLLKRAAVAFKR